MFQPLTEALIMEATSLKVKQCLMLRWVGENLSYNRGDGWANRVSNYTDAVAEMVTAAGKRRLRRGLTNVTFRQLG